MPIGADYLRKKGWDERSINILGYVIGTIGIISMFVGIILITPSYGTSLGMVS